ncbi:MAG: hypothetical protein Q8P46_15880 [Hyphomicrobiales bacterium]|nr:hypothetical protein [Hyphomicrobiales bacterium]
MSNGILQAAVREVLIDAVRDKIRISGLHIDGVEVTQAIQYRSADQHLTDPADRGPDNSVRLVANKAARVRVYVRNFPAAVPGVVGSVIVQRLRYGVWVDAGKLTQVGPNSVTAERVPAYAAERGTMASSLNFIIPAATMRGHLRLKVQVNVPGTSQNADDIVDVDASLLQTLRIRGIPVRYVGPDANGNPLDLAAPTLADFQATAATTLRMYPVSQTPDISLAGTFTWSQPLLGAIVNGQCPQSWNNLLFWLSIARVVDGNRSDSLYYGLFPIGIPIGGAAGCGGGGAGVGSGANGDGMTMAHELGHVLGFAHGPCGLGAGDMGDPNYPAYEPYDSAVNRTASIGEYGCDVTNGTIYPPGNTFDFMSYCGPRWISLYHMRRLINHQRLNPTWVSGGRETLPPYLDEQYHGPSIFDRPDPPPPWVGRQVHFVREPDPVRLIVVTGMLHADHIEIRSVMRLETGPTANGERIPDTFVELLDANLNVLQRAPLRRMATQASCGCGCGCGGGSSGVEPPTGLVQVLLPDTDQGTTLRVIANDKELWVRQTTSQPPTISNVSAVVANDELYVRWQTSASDAYPTERIVRWSDDEGKRWQVLAVNLDDDEAVVSTRAVTSGHILIQVIVSDGFHSTTSDAIAVEIPHRPPTVAILWPVANATVRTDESVRLWGVANTSDGNIVSAEDMHWYLDGEAVGTGPEVWALLADYDGEHKATLKVRDGDEWAAVSVVFFSNCSGRPAYRMPRGD